MNMLIELLELPFILLAIALIGALWILTVVIHWVVEGIRRQLGER